MSSATDYSREVTFYLSKNVQMCISFWFFASCEKCTSGGGEDRRGKRGDVGGGREG